MKNKKSFCEKHKLEICDDCMSHGVWTFEQPPLDTVEAIVEWRDVINQVFDNPQVSNPPTSYTITDGSGEESYTSKYIDVADFESYKKRLKEQLVYRFTHLSKEEDKK